MTMTKSMPMSTLSVREEDDDQTHQSTHTLALKFVAIPLRLLFFGTLLLVIVVRIIIIFIIVIIFSSSLSSALGVLTFQIHCE